MTVSPWYILSVPLAILTSFFAQPNLNAADGCLSYLVMICGFVLLSFHKLLAQAILCGVAGSFYLSAIEKRITAIPADEDENFS